MSSTDDRQLRRFFRDRLTPAAEALRARGAELFPTGPDPEAATFWTGPPEQEQEFLEIEPEAFATALAERWRGEALPELAELAEALMELAFALEFREEQSDEVSPFVYVMY